MPTLEEMRKTAKEKNFIFDVSFIGWKFGERRYNLKTEMGFYQSINYNTLYNVFNLWLTEYCA